MYIKHVTWYFSMSHSSFMFFFFSWGGGVSSLSVQFYFVISQSSLTFSSVVYNLLSVLSFEFIILEIFICRHWIWILDFSYHVPFFFLSIFITGLSSLSSNLVIWHFCTISADWFFSSLWLLFSWFFASLIIFIGYEILCFYMVGY